MKLSKKQFFIFSAILLGLLVLVYANHFDNSFHFDDSHTIVDNVSIRNLKNIPAFFHDPTMFSVSQNHRGVRPLVTTSLAIDYQLAGGLNPWMFQLSTFLWHIGLCIMLFFMYRLLLSKFNAGQWVQWAALFAAGWFALHTVIAETLNYVIARSDVQSTFFIVASFLTYAAYPGKRKYLLYVLLALIGVLAKETVPVLPILLFFYILMFEKDTSIPDIFKRKSQGKVWHTVWVLLPLIIAVAALQVYTLTRMTGESASHGINNPPGYYILTQTYVWFHYFRSFFLPTALSADTDLRVITTWSDPRIWLGIVFVAALVVTIFKTSVKPRTRPIAMGLIWFAASLLPTSLAPFAEVMNDHRMYFAFVGLTLSVVTALGLLLERRSKFFAEKKRYEWLILGAFLILGLNAYGVYQRNQVWDNEESLWKDVTEKSPGNGRGWMNYGLALMTRGDYQGAIEAYKRAEITNPYYSYLFINFGIAYAGLKDSVKAVDNFSKAIVLAPNDFNSYVYFARYYLENAQPQEAIQLAEKAIAINHAAYMPREIAMSAYQTLQMWPELEAMATSTLELVPNDPKVLQYLQAGREKKALVIDMSGAQTAPPVAALINLSLTQYKEGKYEECIASCNLALQIDPQNADAYNNICAAYNMLKEWEKAKEACKKALKINPQHPNVPANLKWAIDQKL